VRPCSAASFGVTFISVSIIGCWTPAVARAHKAVAYFGGYDFPKPRRRLVFLATESTTEKLPIHRTIRARALPRAPGAASCRGHFVRDCRCPRCLQVSHSDWRRLLHGHPASRTGK